MLRFLAARQPPLHRWCHRSSPEYATTCVWTAKVDAANADNHFQDTRPPPPPPPERDALTVLVVDGYGF